MSSQKKQLTLFVTFHVDPAKIEAWKEAHRPVWAACSQEPQCLLFDVLENPSTPGRMRLVEVWSESREWFESVSKWLSTFGVMSY
jgi:quinol monooxygenase YgiN